MGADITTPRVIIAGGGLAGLSAARELADQADVTVIERLPAAGGVWGFEHRDVRRLVAECKTNGVGLLLGATALRWRDHRLLIVGPGQTRWLRANHLVFAGGTRPAHAAELGVTGRRLAGVFTATVAHHLLDASIKLGCRPVVVGWGDWAELVVPQLEQHGQVTVVGGSSRDALPWPRVSWWPDYRPVAVRGGSRVNELDVTDGSSRLTLGCDCVIFAGDPRPLRNIDGANQDGADGVTFIQPVGPGLSATAVIEFARAAAAAVPISRKA